MCRRYVARALMMLHFTLYPNIANDEDATWEMGRKRRCWWAGQKGSERWMRELGMLSGCSSCPILAEH